MPSFTPAQMLTAANKLKALPVHQNPVLTPSALQTHIPAQAQPIVSAVMANPTYARIAASGSSAGSPGTGSTPNTTNLSQHPELNPKNSRTRQANVRHQIVAFGQTNLSSGVTAQVSAIPYQTFKATRCVISPMTISGGTDKASAVSNWQVGTAPQFANLNSEPISMFAASNNAAFLDFNECAPSLSISASVQVAASITFWGALVGEAPGAAQQDRPMRTKVSRLPITSTSIAAASTITVTITPTVDFWGRKIVLADAGTNQWGDTFNITAGANGASGLLLQEIYVANVPQFLSAPTANVTAYVPCALFNGLYDLWLDLDRASVAVPYTFQVYNPGTVTLLFAGVIEGDIYDKG